MHHDHVCWGAGAPHEHAHTLDVRELNVSYGKVEALKELNMRATCGRTLALIGPNGAGKSTLLGALTGLVKISSGEILWNGEPMSRFRHEIAYLPQRSEVDWSFPITVRQLVEMGRYPALGMWKNFGEHDHEIVLRALESLSLLDLQERQISELSGGQQQRAFLARALAQEAHILLLDEPFTGLDVPSTERLAELLRQLAHEGRLVIASHHDLASAPHIFDECLLLRKTLIDYGPTADVLREENLSRAFDRLPSPKA